jgi:hypothetical protein
MQQEAQDNYSSNQNNNYYDSQNNNAIANLSGELMGLGGGAGQPVNMANSGSYQMPSIYETDSFDNPGKGSGLTLGQTFGQMGQTQQAPSQDIGAQMRNLYSQGYSGGQLAAKAQQMGINAQQFAQATGLPMDVVNQAYAGASAYQGGIGSADRNMAGSAGFVKPSNPSTAPNTNPYGITTPNQFASSTNPYIQAAQQTSLGNLAGAQTATAANRVNQQTPYGSLQYTQTGTDAQGNPIWSANQTLSPQLQALTQQSLSGLQQSLTNPAYGINPGQTYSEAIMQRLQPQQEQAQSRLDAQLANQGIMPGSEAYNRAKVLQGQTLNDQLTSAIVGGMQTGLQANTAQNQTAANIKSLATPGYVNPYSQAATTGPDYTGAYATSSAADIAARNAQLAQKNNITSGLFNLGTAGILGSGGLTGLASAIPGAYNWLTGTSGSSNPGIAYDASGAVINSPLTYGVGNYTTSAGNIIDGSGYSNLF